MPPPRSLKPSHFSPPLPPKVTSFHHELKIAAVVSAIGGAAPGAGPALAGGQAGTVIGVVAGSKHQVNA